MRVVWDKTRNLYSYYNTKGVIMQDKKMIHKTIRVEKELWDRFMKIAKAKDSDASKEIRKFIKRYVADNSELFLQLDG